MMMIHSTLRSMALALLLANANADNTRPLRTKGNTLALRNAPPHHKLHPKSTSNTTATLTTQAQRNLQTVTGWSQLGSNIEGNGATDQFGWSVSLSQDGSRMAVAAPQNDAGGADAGSVRVFQYQTTGNAGWTVMGQPLRGSTGTFLGQSVSISGDGSTVAVGSYRLYPYNGFVRIYRWENNNWRELVQLDGITDRDRFGGSVSMNSDGTRVAVGAAYHDGLAGSVGKTEVYEESTTDDTVWNVIGEIFGVTGSRSGEAVALSGDGTTVVVGEIAADPGGMTDAGTVAVFRRTNSIDGWGQLGADIPGIAANDFSGYAVSISENGDIVAIGTPMHSSRATAAGMVRVYFYDYTTLGWVQLGPTIYPETSVVNGKFGRSVSLNSDGTVLAVGEPTDQGVGKAIILFYNADLNTWSRDKTFSEGAATDLFGYSVALAGSGTRVAVGAYNADKNGAVDAGIARVFEFTTSDWIIAVEDFSANFGTGNQPEFTLTFQGTSPPSTGVARTYEMTMLMPGCNFGQATSTAIAPMAPTGAVPADESYRLVTRFDVNTETIRQSGFYSDVSVGKGNIGFCVEMQIKEGNEVRADRKVNIGVNVDMGQEFLVTDFISIDGVRAEGATEVQEETQFAYGFMYYFCDEFGNVIPGGEGDPVPPGGEVSVCLEADASEPVLVDNVKSVSFENYIAPLLGVPLIDDSGNPLDGTTTKDCGAGGVCRIAAITVPRLYEYVDSSGQTHPVTEGVSMEGIVTFKFPNRRNLQDAPEELETTFSVNINLAKPPDRATARQSSAEAFSRSLLVSVAALALTFYVSR